MNRDYLDLITIAFILLLIAAGWIGLKFALQ